MFLQLHLYMYVPTYYDIEYLKTLSDEDKKGDINGKLNEIQI